MSANSNAPNYLAASSIPSASADFTTFMGPLCLINGLVSVGAHFAEAYKNELQRPVASINTGTGIIFRGEMAPKCGNLALWLISYPGHVPLAEEFLALPPLQNKVVRRITYGNSLKEYIFVNFYYI